jgi:hypothetical protein
MGKKFSPCLRDKMFKDVTAFRKSGFKWDAIAKRIFHNSGDAIRTWYSKEKKRREDQAKQTM